MNKILLTLCSLCLLACTACSSSRKGTPIVPAEGMSRELKAAGTNIEALSDSKADKVALQVAAAYTPWVKLSIDGKLDMDKLPLSPSVKMYMERGELIILSLRAPLVGEVGRVEIDRDSILMVNKMKKVYAKESIAGYLGRIGADLTNMQDLFLGRVFLLNAGTLTAGNASLVDVSAGPGDTWIVTPKNQDPRAQYGFTLFADGKMLLACAFTPDEKYFASSEYEYSGSKTRMNMDMKFAGKALKFALDCDAPNYSPNPITPITISGKWKKVDISSWLKSLK